MQILKKILQNTWTVCMFRNSDFQKTLGGLSISATNRNIIVGFVTSYFQNVTPTIENAALVLEIAYSTMKSQVCLRLSKTLGGLSMLVATYSIIWSFVTLYFQIVTPSIENAVFVLEIAYSTMKSLVFLIWGREVHNKIWTASDIITLSIYVVGMGCP